MFYSHEVLTSRKYGVATIWLVATLGSKSSLKKVNRSDIVKVNVPKACETIIMPDAPMALRLQSNLLYGVSRVYLQQCGYVLTDVQSMHVQMSRMEKDAKAVTNDVEIGRGVKSDQLTLPDDPNFLPDFAFGGLELDLSNLIVTTDASSPSSGVSSARHIASSQSSFINAPEIIIPSSDSGGMGGMNFDVVDIDEGRANKLSSVARSAINRLVEDDGGFLYDPGFAFDADGNMYDIPAAVAPKTPPSAGIVANPVGRTREASDTSAYARVRRDHEEAGRIDLNVDRDVNMDFGLDLGEENYPRLPDAEAFSPNPSQLAQQLAQGAPRSSVPRSSTTDEPSLEDESSIYADAPQTRKARKPKTTAVDGNLILAQDVIRTWQTDYLAAMASAHERSEKGRLRGLARRNAEFWIWGRGIGGIGRILGPTNTAHPLAGFYGQRLYDTIAALSDPLNARQKRAHDQIEPQTGDLEAERRVRQRTASADEGARGSDANPLDANNDNSLTLGLDMDMENDPEIGRAALTPLQGDFAHDLSSSMPWNISAARSRQSSLMHPGSRVSALAPFGTGGAGGLGGGLGSLSSATPLHASLGFRASGRFVSASPLMGRGRPLSRQASMSNVPLLDFGGGPVGGGSGQRMSSIAHDLESGLGGDNDGFGDWGDPRSAMQQQQHEQDRERFGAAANVDTQTAGDSQWVRDVMEHESHNFLEYIEAAIARVRMSGEGTVGEVAEEVTFEALLPPLENTKIVAAQGLLHSLSLATRGLLFVRQDEAYGEIRFRMPIT